MLDFIRLSKLCKFKFANLSLQTNFAILTKKKKNARKNQKYFLKLRTKSNKIQKSTKARF